MARNQIDGDQVQDETITGADILDGSVTHSELNLDDGTNPHQTSLNDVVAQDPDTDVTGLELESLTDSSIVDLHRHRKLVDESSTTKIEVVNGGDLKAANYINTRADSFTSLENYLHTDVNGNLKSSQLRTAIAHHLDRSVDSRSTVLATNSTSFVNYFTHTFTPLHVGKTYRVDVSFVYRLDKANQFAYVQGVANGTQYFQMIEKFPTSDPTVRKIESYSFFYVATAGVNTIEINVRSSSASANLFAYYGNVQVERYLA